MRVIRTTAALAVLGLLAAVSSAQAEKPELGFRSKTSKELRLDCDEVAGAHLL